MADADSRAKRQSATCMLMPFMLIGAYPDTAGVDSEERWAITWMYSGIDIGEAVVITWTSAIFKGIDIITGNYVHVIGQYRDT